jgi:hypothetical protein
VETSSAVVVLLLTLVSTLSGFGTLGSSSPLWESSELASAVLALGIACFGTRRRTAVVVAASALCSLMITASYNSPDTQGPALVLVAVMSNLLTLCACVLLFMPRVSKRRYR